MTEAEAKALPKRSGSWEELRAQAEQLPGRLFVYRCDHAEGTLTGRSWSRPVNFDIWATTDGSTG
jgi:hypothetical protein